MTSLRPGQRPPHVTTAARTVSGSSASFWRGPARMHQRGEKTQSCVTTAERRKGGARATRVRRPRGIRKQREARLRRCEAERTVAVLRARRGCGPVEDALQEHSVRVVHERSERRAVAVAGPDAAAHPRLAEGAERGLELRGVRQAGHQHVFPVVDGGGAGDVGERLGRGQVLRDRARRAEGARGARAASGRGGRGRRGGRARPRVRSARRAEGGQGDRHWQRGVVPGAFASRFS